MVNIDVKPTTAYCRNSADQRQTIIGFDLPALDPKSSTQGKQKPPKQPNPLKIPQKYNSMAVDRFLRLKPGKLDKALATSHRTQVSILEVPRAISVRVLMGTRYDHQGT